MNFWYCFAWLPMIVIGIINGVIREQWYAKYLCELRAHQVSTLTEQVQLWRRSYDTPPPALAESDSRHPGRDPRYDNLNEEELPCTESLKDTLNRVLPYWNEAIVPRLREGKRILISAHGNSLRALVKHLKSVSDKDIVALNIPTGIPLV